MYWSWSACSRSHLEPQKIRGKGFGTTQVVVHDDHRIHHRRIKYIDNRSTRDQLRRTWRGSLSRPHLHHRHDAVGDDIVSGCVRRGSRRRRTVHIGITSGASGHTMGNESGSDVFVSNNQRRAAGIARTEDCPMERGAPQRVCPLHIRAAINQALWGAPRSKLFA